LFQNIFYVADRSKQCWKAFVIRRPSVVVNRNSKGKFGFIIIIIHRGEKTRENLTAMESSSNEDDDETKKRQNNAIK
jgi:hypothetical protein